MDVSILYLVLMNIHGWEHVLLLEARGGHKSWEGPLGSGYPMGALIDLRANQGQRYGRSLWANSGRGRAGRAM